MIYFQKFSDSFLVDQQREVQIITDVLSAGNLVLGEHVETFENNWARYTEAENCISVANGLDALILTLRGLGLGKGSKIAVPANTYIATWLAVTSIGAIVIPIDPDPHTYNVEVDNFERFLATGQTIDAVVAVHLYGRPVDMNALYALCSKYNILCIEDAAQAHGATIHDLKIGAHSDAVCWSFYPGKNLGGIGDGGAVTTNNTELASYLQKMRNYGSEKKYYNSFQGVNSRLDAVNAAILSSRLERLDAENSARIRNANYYLSYINNPLLQLPLPCDAGRSVWHQFVIQVENRSHFIDYMKANDVATMIHYPIPPYRQKAYDCLKIESEKYPVTEYLSDRIVSLPVNPFLVEDEISKVISIINGYKF